MGSRFSTQQVISEPRDGHDYSFELLDHIAWTHHLHMHGYVVVKRALSQDEVETSKHMLWTDIEATTGTSGTISRSNVDSWDSWKLPRHGLITSISQGRGAWHVRGCKGVKEAFSKIWAAEDLIVSMDCAIAWRPWWVDPKWKPHTEGLHLDQNPFDKPGLECVQGMVPLRPVTLESGGLQVVPGSHIAEAKKEQKKRFPHLRNRGDWCPLNCEYDDARLLLAEAGDLILWDSRTIHGGLVGSACASSPPDDGNTTELARLAVAVSMVPRAWASTEIQQARVDGFQAGKTFNHSPHEAGTSSGTLGGKARKGYKPIDLTSAQLALL